MVKESEITDDMKKRRRKAFLKDQALNYLSTGNEVPEDIKNGLSGLLQITPGGGGSGSGMKEIIFDFVTNEYENGYSLEEHGAIDIDGMGDIFDKGAHYEIKPSIPISGKSFGFEADLTPSESRNAMYFIGDHGTGVNNKTFHAGWRNKSTFIVAFWGNGWAVNFPAVAGRDYNIKFDFDANTKKAVLEINGRKFEHKYKNKYLNNIDIIGKASHNPKSYFSGEIRKIILKVEV